ncbi:MAG: GHKL domain-containing protein [Methylophaga sp.]|nr:GHKL domain-containing protein [Methylophaga sp.]
MTIKLSLSNRLLLAVSFVLSAFLGLSAFSLNNAFQASADSAQRKQLDIIKISLLTALEFDEAGLITLEKAINPNFNIPNSGLYAQVTTGREIVWQSHSMLGMFLALPEHPGKDNETFSTIQLNDDEATLLNLAFGITWENEQGKEFSYTLNVSQDLDTIMKQKANFQLSLWYSLGGTGLMLLIAQAFILRWGLRPLHDVAIDLNAIESGEHQRLSKHYPKELNQLTQNINTLLDHEHSRRERYKNSLADLAHSLKTPLAVMRGEFETNHNTETLRNTAHEQLDRVAALVDYQLQRAATEGQSSLQAPVSLGEIIHKILGSLDKVYQSKNIHRKYQISHDIFIHADEGDMYELLGNLLENAYKYCNKHVAIFVETQSESIEITIDDDGNGIPEEAQNDIIKRGKRLDTQKEGHGLGLAIVSDIIEAYQGSITIERSHLGGAKFILHLPK